MSVSEAGDLKHRLAGWKELIVLVDSVLAWEKVSFQLQNDDNFIKSEIQSISDYIQIYFEERKDFLLNFLKFL